MNDGSTLVMLTGDVMLARGIDQVLAHPSGPRLYEPHVSDAREYVRLAEAVNGTILIPVAPTYVWGDALDAMARAAPDLRIVNLECAVTTSDQAWPAKGIHYRMHPANVDTLGAARIDCCVLANNHVLDWGHQGLVETLKVLRHAGLETAGAGGDGDEAWAPAVLRPGGRGRVLVFGCATPSSGVAQGWAAGPRRAGIALLPDLSDASAQQLAADVARCRQATDRVVVSIHWGANWGLEVPGPHRAFAHRLIDLGAADLVHGHSSHHPMPFEVYRDRLILYGCGDLINDYEGIGAHGDLRSDVGCLYFVALEPDSGHLRRLDIVPFELKRFRLGTANAAARSWLMAVFGAGGRGTAAPLATRAEGGWSLHWPSRA